MENSSLSLFPGISILALVLAVLSILWSMGRAPAGKGVLAFIFGILCALLSGARFQLIPGEAGMGQAIMALLACLFLIFVFRIRLAVKDREPLAFWLSIPFIIAMNKAAYVILTAIGV